MTDMIIAVLKKAHTLLLLKIIVKTNKRKRFLDKLLHILSSITVATAHPKKTTKKTEAYYCTTTISMNLVL